VATTPSTRSMSAWRGGSSSPPAEPEPARVVGVLDRRARDVGPAAESVEQRLDEARLDERVVVQQHRVVRASRERALEAPVVPSREAEVRPRLEHLDLGEGGAHLPGTPVGRAVVDEDHMEARVPGVAERGEARLRVGPAVPVQDDDGDLRRRGSHRA